MSEQSKTLGLAHWLQEEAEACWGCATNEDDKLRARRMQECASELLRYHRLKIRFRDQLSPMRTKPAPSPAGQSEGMTK